MIPSLLKTASKVAEYLKILHGLYLGDELTKSWFKILNVRDFKN